MSTQSFDKLNKLKSMPFEKYFGEMSLTKEQERNRIVLAQKLEEVLWDIFIYAEVYKESGIDNSLEVKNSLNERVLDSVASISTLDDEMSVYVANMTSQVVDTTFNHVGDKYYTSDDRARYIAENESNTIFNKIEYKQAIASGMTKKVWVSMNDTKVRNSHFVADGEKVDIDKPFIVGSSFMMFPKDESLGASPDETINCRCSVEYSK